MKIKEGVDIRGLNILMREAIVIAEQVYIANKQELVITSGLEGTHSAGSVHYYGLAIDIRTRFFDEKKKSVWRELVLRLSNFKVLLEKTHIHIEYRYWREYMTAQEKIIKILGGII